MGAPAIVMGDKITGQCAIHMTPTWCATQGTLVPTVTTVPVG